MQCDRVLEVAPHQQRELDRLQTIGLALSKHLHTKYPHEIAWRTLQKSWNGEVFLGPTTNRASFNTENGCVVIGVPRDAARLDSSLLNTRFLLALSKGASGSKMCTDIHSVIVSEATKTFGINVAIDCSDAYEYAINTLDKCPGCEWRSGAPSECHGRRSSWPELLGSQALNALNRFPPQYQVELVTWDTLSIKPAAPDVVRVTYDAPSGIIVDPAPYVGTLNVPDFENECFMKPDGGLQCIGAPLDVPPLWHKYIGSDLPDAIDSLRMRYVHATIEAMPTTARVSDDKRPDRIRVWYDAATGKVDRVPTIG